MSQYQISVKDKADHDMRESHIELARMNGKYLYDQVFITKFEIGAEILVHYQFERNSKRITPPAVHVGPRDWAVAGALVGKDRMRFAETVIAQRLFSEGSMHFNQQNIAVEENHLGNDMNLLSTLTGVEPVAE